ncbi:MAG: DASH family cryptochrome [Schleiferiaceae bacterium]|nr:DASH family cryptochrome [Schleiferiaceae bacterium]
MKTCLLWFRNNLRLSDNLPVYHAYQHYDQVIPVYLYPTQYAEHPSGNFPWGEHKQTFVTQSVASLSLLIEVHGSSLLVDENEGTIVERLCALVAMYEVDAIVGPTEPACNEQMEELALDQWAAERNIETNWFEERTLFEQHQLPFELADLPQSFTPFRKKLEKYSQPAAALPEPSLTPSPVLSAPWTPIAHASLDERSAHPYQGGIRAAWDRLDHYLWDTEHITTYKETRNGMLGADFSSKFSAFLAIGCISTREIYAEIKRFEHQITSNESTYWLYFELLWREYFQWIARKHGRDLFLQGGLQPTKPKKNFRNKHFEMWKNGTTGDPLVDANMIELAATGFMSNRGRQNVASYLVHDLHLDWRYGAAWFEAMLVDHDPASNYGNWLYIAGVGNDPRPFRKFNTSFQAERYDPKGEYVNTWLD